jgi:hypothetical protein
MRPKDRFGLATPGLNFPFLSLIKRFFPTNYGFNEMRIFMRIAEGNNYEFSPVNLTRSSQAVTKY